jgi:hypothetical protein
MQLQILEIILNTLHYKTLFCLKQCLHFFVYFVYFYLYVVILFVVEYILTFDSAVNSIISRIGIARSSQLSSHCRAGATGSSMTLKITVTPPPPPITSSWNANSLAFHLPLLVYLTEYTQSGIGHFLAYIPS